MTELAIVITFLAILLIGNIWVKLTAKPKQFQSMEIERHHIVLKKHKKLGTVNIWYGCSQSTRIQIKEYSNNFMEVEIKGPYFSIRTALYGKIEELTLEVGKNDAYLLNGGRPAAAAYIHRSYTFEDIKEVYSFELYKSKLERVLR